MTIQHTLTHQIFEKTYDAIICATGYDIKAWLQLLASSKIGRVFGLQEHSHEEVCLAVMSDLDTPGTGGLILEFDDTVPTDEQNGMSSLNTSISTLPTSRASVASIEDHPSTFRKLFVSRAYQLLPKAVDPTDALQARVYVQGVAEETHGLSDTLLSVVALRAGEIVDDICAGVHDLLC